MGCQDSTEPEVVICCCPVPSGFMSQMPDGLVNVIFDPSGDQTGEERPVLPVTMCTLPVPSGFPVQIPSSTGWLLSWLNQTSLARVG